MNVVRCSEAFAPFSGGCGVGLGNFDGVHLGHMALIRLLKEKCREAGLPSVMYTFSMHPTHVIHKMEPAPLIMTEEQRLDLFEQCGIDTVCLEDFTEEYASLSPRAFAEEILVQKLNARLVVVGYDYTFGFRGAGSTGLLQQLGEELGFRVFILPPVEVDGEKVSSTVLRQLISRGEVRNFKRYAGRYYSIPGEVVVGRRVGRQLGFPTANILPRKGFALPSPGVYLTDTRVGEDGKLYRSVTNIGANPTFDEQLPVTVETHILDYDRGLYGDRIEVFFLDKLREEIRFESVEALRQQLQRDVSQARIRGDRVQ